MKLDLCFLCVKSKMSLSKDILPSRNPYADPYSQYLFTHQIYCYLRMLQYKIRIDWVTSMDIYPLTMPNLIGMGKYSGNNPG